VLAHSGVACLSRRFTAEFTWKLLQLSCGIYVASPVWKRTLLRDLHSWMTWRRQEPAKGRSWQQAHYQVVDQFLDLTLLFCSLYALCMQGWQICKPGTGLSRIHWSQPHSLSVPQDYQAPPSMVYLHHLVSCLCRWGCSVVWASNWSSVSSWHLLLLHAKMAACPCSGGHHQCLCSDDLVLDSNTKFRCEHLDMEWIMSAARSLHGFATVHPSNPLFHIANWPEKCTTCGCMSSCISL